MTVKVTKLKISPILNIFYCQDCQESTEYGGTKMKCLTCKEPMDIIGVIEDGTEALIDCE